MHTANNVVTRAIITIARVSPVGKKNLNGNSKNRKNWAVTAEDKIIPTIKPNIREESTRLYCSYIKQFNP